MIVVNSSKILDAVLEEAAEQKIPTLLTIKKLTKLREFPIGINMCQLDFSHSGVINYGPANIDNRITWDQHRYSQIASMAEDISADTMQFVDSESRHAKVKRYVDFSGEYKSFGDIKSRSFLIGKKTYTTINPESVGFVNGDVLAVYEISAGNSTLFIRRTLDRNSSAHTRNYYTRYGREALLNNIKTFYYDQVFTCGPPSEFRFSYSNNIVDSFEKAWSKHKRSVINNLRKSVQKEDLEDYVAENKCHRTQAVMDLSFKISALEGAVSCYKKELLSAGCDMKRLKDYANTIDSHTRALKSLNYVNRNVLGNRVMNVPGGKATIEKLLAKK